MPVFAGLQICFDLQRAQLSPLLHVEREHLRWAAERAAGQRLRRPGAAWGGARLKVRPVMVMEVPLKK